MTARADAMIPDTMTSPPPGSTRRIERESATAADAQIGNVQVPPDAKQRLGDVLAPQLDGRWRWATVRARQDWPDGRVAYQVSVDLDGSTSVRARTYWWPHPGLRVAHRSAYPSSTGPVEAGGLSVPPRRPPR
ncbi:hypothetical protein [Streptomyces sp. NPDC056817]|uniref:hypothetical protein n=1 Tax=Streptomyces sp. NPDC056817 TaxID=3345950 RepID=UPI0036A65688